MSPLLCLQVIHLWSKEWPSAHHSLQLLRDPEHSLAASSSGQSMIMSSHGPDATAQPGQAVPTHGQTARLGITAWKEGVSPQGSAPSSAGISQPGRWGVKCKYMSTHLASPSGQQRLLGITGEHGADTSLIWTQDETELEWQLNFYWQVIFTVTLNLVESLSYLGFSTIQSPVSISNMTESRHMKYTFRIDISLES